MLSVKGGPSAVSETDRAEVPLLRWTDLATWYPRLTTLLNSLLEPGAIDRLARAETSGFYDDDPDWFELVVDEFAGSEDWLVDLVVEQLLAWKLRVFHGTRVSDAGSFMRDGIRLHDRASLEAEVRAAVEAREDLRCRAATLDRRFEETAHLIDHGRCYVVVDERVLVEQCGHYLLGGSEFIQGIIGPEGAQAAFEQCTPTVIEVDLPLGRVRESQLRQLASKLVGEWAKILRRGRKEPRYLDFTFVLREPVPAEWVVGHFHPPVVNDPHRMRAPVRILRTTCAACEPPSR
jgi:hypothetical protein